MTWIQVGLIGCGFAALFVLFRDVAITLSPKVRSATVFGLSRYAFYGVIGFGVANLVNFLWNLG